MTDANVVLGRINPNYFLGGQMQLNGDAAFSSVAGLAEVLKTQSRVLLWVSCKLRITTW